jgi:hypothetical protein
MQVLASHRSRAMAARREAEELMEGERLGPRAVRLPLRQRGCGSGMGSIRRSGSRALRCAGTLAQPRSLLPRMPVPHADFHQAEDFLGVQGARRARQKQQLLLQPAAAAIAIRRQLRQLPMPLCRPAAAGAFASRASRRSRC